MGSSSLFDFSWVRPVQIKDFASTTEFCFQALTIALSSSPELALFAYKSLARPDVAVRVFVRPDATLHIQSRQRHGAQSWGFQRSPGIHRKVAAEAVRSSAEILDGQHDDVPVEASYFSGGMAEIKGNTGRTRTFGPVTL
jgi:hypothetical protein